MTQFNIFLGIIERVLDLCENLIHSLISKLKQTKRQMKNHNKSCGFTMKLSSIKVRNSEICGRSHGLRTSNEAFFH